MKTVVFFLSPTCGGAERMTITIAKLLDRSRYDVRFVVIGRKICEIKEFIPKEYPISLIRIKNIYDFTTFRVYQYLKKTSPNLVFCSLVYLNARIILASRWIGGCKIIVRCDCAVERISKINAFLSKKTYKKADIVIGQTQKMRDDLKKRFCLPEDKVITIHNVLDKKNVSEKLKNIENPYVGENNYIFVWVGRFSFVKGADIVVKAFLELAQCREDVSLYLVGKIDPKNDFYQLIKNIVEKAGFQNRVHFLGFQDNPYKWMKYADCLVLSSRSEGSPNVLFEALYVGVPAVVTRCTPNIEEIVVDGINGYKVAVNDINGMSVCMEKALELGEVKPMDISSSEDDYKKIFQY